MNLPRNPTCLEEPKGQGREAPCSPDSSLVLKGALPEPTLLQRREPGLVSRHLVIKEVNRQKVLAAYCLKGAFDSLHLPEEATLHLRCSWWSVTELPVSESFSQIVLRQLWLLEYNGFVN